jgi:hypothetical protein
MINAYKGMVQYALESDESPTEKVNAEWEKYNTGNGLNIRNRDIKGPLLLSHWNQSVVGMIMVRLMMAHVAVMKLPADVLLCQWLLLCITGSILFLVKVIIPAGVGGMEPNLQILAMLFMIMVLWEMRNLHLMQQHFLHGMQV